MNTVYSKDITINDGLFKYYVYSLRAINEQVPFYIGVSALNRPRYNEHMCRARKGDTQLVYTKIRKCWKDEVSIIHEILFSSESQKTTFEMEKFLIASYGRQDISTGILKNHTEGGEGPNSYKHTEEAKRKMSLAKMGSTINLGRKRPDNIERFSKEISMFNHEGRLVKTFSSARTAEIETGIHFSVISGVASGKRARAKQASTGNYFVFHFTEKGFTEIPPFTNKKSRRKRREQ